MKSHRQDVDNNNTAVHCVYVTVLICFLFLSFFFWQNVEDDVSTEMEDYVNDNPVIEVDDSGVPVCPPVVLIINLNFQK